MVGEPSIDKARYFITFLDDYSRKTFVYFLKQKDEMPSVIEKFIKLAENQSGKRLKTLRTDNGREYVNSCLKSTLDRMGIRHETSIPYQPQQNGRAERVNRTLLEKTRCVLAEAKLPNKFWAEAISTSCYLSNRSPKRCLGGCTPQELWTGQKPNLGNLKVFGCKARAFIPSQLRSKIEATSRPAIMLGYCEDQRGYRLWSHEDQKVFSASNVEFFEDEQTPTSLLRPAYLPLDSAQSVDLEEEFEEQHNDQHRGRDNISDSSDNIENLEDLPMEIGNHAKPTEEKKNENKSAADAPQPVTRSALKRSHSEDDGSSEEELQTNPARKSQRKKHKPRHLDDSVTYSIIVEQGEPRIISMKAGHEGRIYIDCQEWYLETL